MVTLHDVLRISVTDGIQTAKDAYKDERSKDKLDGSIDGLTACVGATSIEELIDIYNNISTYVRNAKRDDYDNYFYFRFYQLRVEWILDIISAILVNEGMRSLSPALPTIKGITKATTILNRKHEEADNL
jgi:hypothetical protein